MRSLKSRALLVGLLAVLLSGLSATQTSATDYTDRASFEAASGGTVTTIGFVAPDNKDGYSGSTALVVSGIAFSTSIPGVTVNVTRAHHYPNYPYDADFIVSSDVGASQKSAPNNELSITLPCPTRAIGIDFGGLGFQAGSQTLVPGSATITLSNGHGYSHAYSQATLPTAGNTTFVGFVSTTPFTSLILKTVNDSWVIKDVAAADCYGPTKGSQTETNPTPSPTPDVGYRQALLTPGTGIATPSDSPTETATNDCVFQPYVSHPGLLTTPLQVTLDYLASKNSRFLVAPDGTWVPLPTTTFPADSTFPNLYSLPLRTAQTTYTLSLSQEGVLTITETGSSNSLIAGSGMTQLTGSENWSATQIVDLTSGKDTLTFNGELNAHYIGGSQQQPGKATTCTISSRYSGEYDSVDAITLSDIPEPCSLCSSIANQYDSTTDRQEAIQLCHMLMGALHELGNYHADFQNQPTFINLFPTIYYNTTSIEMQRMAASTFQHPIQKMRQMVAFFDSYKSNRDTYNVGRIPEPQWQAFYAAASDAERQIHSRLPDLFPDSLGSAVVRVTEVGVIAHVDYDFPRALRYSYQGSMPDPIDFDDFVKTNETIKTSANASTNDIYFAFRNSYPWNTLLLVPAVSHWIDEELGITQSVIDKRLKAWKTAFQGNALLPTTQSQPVTNHNLLAEEGVATCSRSSSTPY